MLKTYRLRINILSIFLFGLIAFAPYGRFYLHNFFVLWPYFNWELGFGSIPYATSWQVLYIDQIDDKTFDPPVALNEYIQNHSKQKLYWVATQHYKIQTMLTQANHRKDKKEFERVKSLIGRYWFDRIAKETVRYHVAIVDLDPMEFRKNQKLLDKRVILKDVYTKPETKRP